MTNDEDRKELERVLNLYNIPTNRGLLGLAENWPDLVNRLWGWKHGIPEWCDHIDTKPYDWAIVNYENGYSSLKLTYCPECGTKRPEQ